jgi:hypothetical protein
MKTAEQDRIKKLEGFHGIRFNLASGFTQGLFHDRQTEGREPNSQCGISGTCVRRRERRGGWLKT